LRRFLPVFEGNEVSLIGETVHEGLKESAMVIIEKRRTLSSVALVDYSSLQRGLSQDWLELLLTMALFLAVLLGLYVVFLS
jgi:hypothetical protein